MAILWSFGMAIGILFIYLTPGYAPNLMTYLFGNILVITTTDLISLASVTFFSKNKVIGVFYMIGVKH